MAERSPEFKELDQIKAKYEAAKTPREYQEVDKMYFLIDPEIRATWLADQAKAWT